MAFPSPRDEGHWFGAPEILAVDGPLVVVVKPSGFAAHPAEGSELDLVSWLADHPDLPAGTVPAHRLDKETSGLILCSPEASLRAELSEDFAQGRIHKHYLALVDGATRDRGAIRRALPDARRKRKLDAETTYCVVERLGGFTLLAVKPTTGRRHQIRRHLQGVGHAVVGDDRYRPHRFHKVPDFPGRLWLHAAQLILPDGRVFDSPLPPELMTHLEVLRRGAEHLAVTGAQIP